MMFFAELSISGVIRKIAGAVAILALVAAAFAVTAPAFAQTLGEDIFCDVSGGLSEGGLDFPPCDEDEEEPPADVCPQDEGVQTDESECTPADSGEEGDGEGEEEESSGETGSSDTGSSSGGGGGGGGGGSLGGQVLGASTDACSTPLLTTYLRMGKQNDSGEVALLQIFLNKELGSTLPVTGMFGADTKAAVEQFQVKYADEVLAPWVPFGLVSSTTPTGYVYKTTQRMINKIHCASLEIPMPQLP